MLQAAMGSRVPHRLLPVSASHAHPSQCSPAHNHNMCYCHSSQSLGLDRAAAKFKKDNPTAETLPPTLELWVQHTMSKLHNNFFDVPPSAAPVVGLCGLKAHGQRICWGCGICWKATMLAVARMRCCLVQAGAVACIIQSRTAFITCEDPACHPRCLVQISSRLI
jgi:hypothetical protein